jgi:hypothetical protein
MFSMVYAIRNQSLFFSVLYKSCHLNYEDKMSSNRTDLLTGAGMKGKTLLRLASLVSNAIFCYPHQFNW